MLGARLARVVFFALIAAVFTSLYPYLPRIRNPNENTRTYTTMSLVEEHTFRVDEEVKRYAYTNDLARVPLPDGSSHLYAVKAPGNTYLGVPVYWALRALAPRLHLRAQPPTKASSPDDRERWFTMTTFVLRLLTVQLPCLLFLFWLERWLRSTTSDVVLRLAAVAGAGLGTNYLAYSLMFVSHALCAVCAFMAFGLTVKSWLEHTAPRFRSARVAFAVGLLAGGSVMFEYYALPVAVILSVFALCVHRRPLQVVALVVGGIINVAGMALYQWRSFGSPLTPGHKFVEDAAFRAQHAKGLYGIELPNFVAIKQLAFSHSFGFFGTSPFMWLGLVAVPFGLFVGARGRRDRRKLRVVILVLWFVVLAAFVPVSGFLNWRGGWTVGPRHWSIGPPFFAFGAAFGLEQVATRWPRVRPAVRALAAGLALASVIQTGLVSITYNTLPMSITRPLAQAALPLLRDGFVPHHLGELVGWQGTRFFYVVAGCMLVAALVPVVVRVRESWVAWGLRSASALIFAAVALVPAFSAPLPDEKDEGTGGVRFLVDSWDPPGRDAIHRKRDKASPDAAKTPCERAELARMERLVGMFTEATRDEVGTGQAPCGGAVAKVDSFLLAHAHLSGAGAPKR